jgi:uncharacterized protein (DUF305 family)
MSRTSRSTRTARRLTALTGAGLAGLLLLSACGDGDDPTVGAGSDTAGEVAESAPYNAQDITFVSGMKPHHEQAVEMADMILEKDPSPEVRALAQQIKGAQQPEIDQLEDMLDTFGVEGTAGGEHGGEHGGGHSSDSAAGHEGMMSEEQMAELEAASGVEAERLFLEMMIEHHTGAVSASETEIAEGEYDEAIALAREIKTAQEAEITEMKVLLESL